METFGQTLRRLRTQRGETLAQVAENLTRGEGEFATKVSIPMLSRIETDDRYPSTRTAVAIAAYFGVPADEAIALLTESQARRKWSTLSEIERGAQPLPQIAALSFEPADAPSEATSIEARSTGPAPSGSRLRESLRAEEARFSSARRVSDDGTARNAGTMLELAAQQLVNLLGDDTLPPLVREELSERARLVARSLDAAAKRQRRR